MYTIPVNSVAGVGDVVHWHGPAQGPAPPPVLPVQRVQRREELHQLCRRGVCRHALHLDAVVRDGARARARELRHAGHLELQVERRGQEDQRLQQLRDGQDVGDVLQTERVAAVRETREGRRRRRGSGAAAGTAGGRIGGVCKV